MIERPGRPARRREDRHDRARERRRAGPGRARVVGRVVAGVLAVWLVAAVWLGVSGLTASARGPLAVAAIWAWVAALVAAYVASRPFRTWALALDPRVAISFHLTRFVGVLFLALHAEGRLPYEFAVPAAWGDIVVATAAPFAAAAVPWRTRGRRLTVLAWNVAGLADILFVVATGMRLRLVAPESMAALWAWPFSLVPTFVVPLVIATHLLLFAQLRRISGQASVLPSVLGTEQRSRGPEAP